jgi:formylglycine-generating enzyme required for sulfatase activity
VVRFCEGNFEMGTASGGEDHERPVRDVLVYAFDLAVHETTVAEYALCVDSGVCSPVANPDDIPARCNWDKPDRDDHPMNCVNFEMATTFCAFVGGRLPSEAEWEYAARSEGQPPLYPWGDEEPSCDRAVMPDTCGAEGTWPVCSKPAGNTAQGLCDFSGNAFEWTQDWFHDDYTGAPPTSIAWEEPVGTFRVMRGGGIGSDEDYRNRNRTFHEPDFFVLGDGVSVWVLGLGSGARAGAGVLAVDHGARKRGELGDEGVYRVFTQGVVVSDLQVIPHGGEAL